MNNFILADAHAPESQYDIFFDAEAPVDLTKDDTIIYVNFKDFATAMDWLQRQENTASILLRNGDMGLEKNDFCYYFASTAGLTSFMFTDYEIPVNLNYLYVQNLNVDHPKMRHHPLGVLTKNTGKLKRVIEETRGMPKVNKCYVNFKLETCLFRQLLPQVIQAEEDWVTVEENVSQLEYYRQLASHQFVACPRGNGHDSFRVWETLAVGSIPIVTRTVGMERLKEFVPILMMEEWGAMDELKDEFSREKLVSMFSKRGWWSEMLTQDFWTRHVKNQRSLELVKEEEVL